MGVAVVLAGPVVMVALGARVERRELLEPALVVLVQPGLVIVDEHRRGDVHGVNQTKTLGNAAAPDEIFNRRGNVDEPSTARDFEPEMFGQRFHWLRAIS